MKGKTKLISSMIFLMILMSLFVYALTSTTLDKPEDNFYLIKGGAIMGNITFNGTGIPTPVTGNISNMTLWTNISGNWKANYTNSVGGTVANDLNYLFTTANTGIFSEGLADGLVFTWNIRSANLTGDYDSWGVNRTVFVEDAPFVTLVVPADNAVISDNTVPIVFNVTGDSDVYTCQVWSNDTGTWAQESGGTQANNASNKTLSKVISEGNGIKYNIFCSESANSNIRGWATANYTITVDTTAPVITATIGAYSTDNYEIEGWSGNITTNVTDANANNCNLYINGTLNWTDSYTSGIEFFIPFNASDGTYNWMVTCDDSGGLSTSTANTSIIIDTITPGMTSNKNYSSPVNCKGFPVEFILDEAANLTFTYGLSSMAQSYKEIEIDYATNQTITLTFNDSYETDFFANVSFCDIAGNCNDTFGEMTIPSPIPLCTGWSLWSVYDTAINLSDYRTDSGADYVYYWNNTGQSWMFSSDAGSSSEDYVMKKGDVAQVYESVNTTYFRNNTGTPSYDLNVTGGHVYFGLYHNYNFGNISHYLFRNETGGNITGNNTEIISAGGLQFQIDYLSSFNNSNKQYVDSIFTWLWNNATLIGPPYKNGLDNLWAYIPYNLTFKVTPGGYVMGNWSA